MVEQTAREHRGGRIGPDPPSADDGRLEPRPGPPGTVVGMRVATYNVNSVRARVGRVVDWLVREDVDVVGLQEIKCKPEQFPYDAFREAGYEVELHGLSQWNGVAFASRLPMEDVEITFPSQPGFAKGQEGPDQPKEARAIGVTVEGVRLWSLYVPNGRELGDPHYDYKLDWLSKLATETEAWLAARPDQPLALMGDWNVAPLDTDVWDMSVFEGHTHVSQPERDAFFRFEEVGLTDVVRSRLPEGYTYWDYKQLRFPKNEGMRIDFVLGSKAFDGLVTSAAIHRDERKGDAPSDHVPVVVDLDLETELDDDRPMIF
ncbi:exodeoxyribonuclease-3 [Frigoribacterium sp. 2355]